MMSTTTSGFQMQKVQGDLINDPELGLYGEMEDLGKDDMKERLIVAEKVMKSLFHRNRELEEKMNTDDKTTASTFENK